MEEYYIATINFSGGNAYTFREVIKTPTIIKYGRIHDGAFQEGEIKGNYSNTKLMDIIYQLKIKS